LIPLRLRQVGALRVTVLEIGRERVLAMEQKMAGNTFRTALGTEYAEGPIPAAWKPRLGRYAAVGPSPVLPGFTLQEKRDVLLATGSSPATGRVEWVRDPVSDDEAVVLGLGRGGGETVYARPQAGGPVGFAGAAVGAAPWRARDSVLEGREVDRVFGERAAYGGVA